MSVLLQRSGSVFHSQYIHSLAPVFEVGGRSKMPHPSVRPVDAHLLLRLMLHEESALVVENQDLVVPPALELSPRSSGLRTITA